MTSPVPSPLRASSSSVSLVPSGIPSGPPPQLNTITPAILSITSSQQSYEPWISSSLASSTSNKSGEKLYSVWRMLKLEQLYNKSDLFMMNKIESGLKQSIVKVNQSMGKIHSLGKKIEILEYQYTDGNNITKLLVEESVVHEPEELPKKTFAQVSEIIKGLRTEPKYLAEGLWKGGWLNTDRHNRYHAKMSRVLICCLFRNCFSPYDEKLFLKFMMELCKYEVSKHEKSETPSSCLLSPFFGTLFATYLRFTACSDYLRQVMQEILTRVIQANDLQMDSSQLSKLVTELFKRITSDGLATMPFGIRIISLQLKKLAEQQTTTLGYNYLKELLFNNCFLLCLLQPAFFFSITGVEIPSTVKNNLATMALKIKSFVENHVSCSDFYSSVTNIIPDLYLPNALLQGGDHEGVFGVDSFVLSKSEFESLLELLAPVFSDPNLNTKDSSFLANLAEFVAEQRRQTSVKTEYHRIHPRKLLKLGNPSSILPYPNPPPSKHLYDLKPEIKKPVEEIKTQLLYLLSETSILPFHKGSSVLTCLSNLAANNWNKPQVSALMAQLHEIMKGLSELPAEMKKEDYCPLFDQMILDHENRIFVTTAKKDFMYLAWDELTLLAQKMLNQQNQLLDYFISFKIRQFTIESFGKIRTGFLEDFMKQFKNSTNCQCNVLDSMTCEQCKLKSDTFQKFFDMATSKVKQSPLWQGVEPEEIDMALKQIERTIMSVTFDWTMLRVKDDDILIEEISKLGTIDVHDFEISSKYHSEAPWPFATAELRKMNTFKSPWDKFVCISKTWEIISNCVSLVDDPGPDACYPIMIFVIYSVVTSSSKRSEIFTNLNYLNNYCFTMNEMDRARYLAFRTVAKALLRSITGNGAKDILKRREERKLLKL